MNVAISETVGAALQLNFHPYNGPSYAGFVFNLQSSSGKSNHLLTISTQVSELLFYQAYITGTWQGEDSSGPMGTPKQVTGLITDNGTGIKCSWTTPNGTNTLTGSLTYTPGHFLEEKIGNIPIVGFVPPQAFLQGTVTAYDANGNVLPGMGPGDVSGYAKGWPFGI